MQGQKRVPLITRLVRNRRLELIEKEITKDMKILDLGCGDGWLTNYLISRGYNCIGVDKTVPKDDSHFHAEDVSNLSFTANTFDCIIMIEVIEHIQPHNYDEVERILKPNGKIILTTPLPEFNWLVELLEKLGIVNPLVTEHINLIDLRDLAKRWRLLKEDRIFVIDQFGVFQV